MKLDDPPALPLPTQRALTIHLSSGSGKGPTPLAAFHAALVQAGVANYHLLCLSSVIPPNARIVRTRHRARRRLRLRAVVTGATAAQAHGAIRSARERVIQALAFETGGLLVVSPLFAHFTGARTGDALIVLVALSIAVMVWSAFYNTAFDRVEHGLTGRVASDRLHGLRVLHTLGAEATAVIVTWPLLVALTPLGWRDALVADIGLTLAYALYGYFFHWGFDRLRPVHTITRSTQ